MNDSIETYSTPNPPYYWKEVSPGVHCFMRDGSCDEEMKVEDYAAMSPEMDDEARIARFGNSRFGWWYWNGHDFLRGHHLSARTIEEVKSELTAWYGCHLNRRVFGLKEAYMQAREQSEQYAQWLRDNA